MRTTISISLSSSTSYTGSKIEISGNLTSDVGGLSETPIFLSYSITNGETWSDIKLVTTAPDGGYSASWTPPAPRNYLVRASWTGNSSFLGTSATFNLTVISLKEQNGFSVMSNSTISELAFEPTSRELSFNVSSETGTVGYCNVTIPKDVLKGNPWTVKIDGEFWSFISSENTTHSSIYFTYTYSSTPQVTIKGTWAIPEFPSALIPPLFIIATLLAVMVYRRKKHKQKGKSLSKS